MTVAPYLAALAIRELLIEQGIRATVDIRDLNPPCVLIEAPELRYRYGPETADAQWTALCVVPNVGPGPALHLLQGLLTDTLLALNTAGIAPTAARPVTIQPQVKDPGGPLPAYALTWTDTLN